MSQRRYIFAAGFLGAGKTTALAAAACQLQQQGRQVALLTNDLGGELVDTAAFRGEGFRTEEISGGSLAARFSSLAQALGRLEDAEIVLIEPVGCLADLASTVLAPLRRDAGEAVMLAPLSVLVDPRHAEALLDHASGARDGESLRYLVRRQLEEADLILLTQIDRLEPGRAEALRARLAAKFPEACVLAISARHGSGLREWLALLESGPIRTAPAAAIDGERYAQAVAQLGWLDATIEFVLPKTASGSALLQSVGGHLQVALEGSKLLHLKVALSTEDAAEAGLLGLVPQDDAPELICRCDAALETGEFIVNVRAETHPEKLHTAVRAAIVELTREFHGLQTEFAHLHYFRPPKPTLATPA